MKKLIITISKLIVLALSLGYIINKLITDNSTENLINHISEFNFQNAIVLFIVIALVVVNWLFESVKWKLLICSIEEISIAKAIKSVFCGITVSIFTPNRIGEFGGRIFVLKKENRIEAIFATLLGNMAQLLTTVLFGLFFLPKFTSLFRWNKADYINYNLFLIIILVVIVLGFIVYFLSPQLIRFLSKYKNLDKWRAYVLFIEKLNKIVLAKILALSIFRYVVFSTQYFILLRLFNVEIDYYNAIMAISQIYMVMAVIPTFALSEVGVRGSVAMLIFGLFNIPVTGVLLAAITLWIVNLAIPALIGSYFLWKLKI